jgi:succinate dehydrogenase/fumarate reductase-like Fe-S protein
MDSENITVTVFRFEPSSDKEPRYQSYEVPFEKGMSALNALDYIYQNLDGTLAYHDHAGCGLGICTRCTALINGRRALLCQEIIKGDILLEPISKKTVIRDLVTRIGPKGAPSS